MIDALVAVWTLANLFTAGAYAMIPLEMWRWRHAMKGTGAGWIIVAFAFFIFACGMHHVYMPFTGHPTHMKMSGLSVVALQALNDVVMCVASLVTHHIIRSNRDQIVRALGRLSS